MTFPEILTPEVQIAFEALVEALSASADTKGVELVGVALTWAGQHRGSTGFNCMFTDGLTPEIAEHMAGVLLMDDVIKGSGKGDMAIKPDHSLGVIDGWKRFSAFRAAVAEGRG